jgi:hypothetical protein
MNGALQKVRAEFLRSVPEGGIPPSHLALNYFWGTPITLLITHPGVDVPHEFLLAEYKP